MGLYITRTNTIIKQTKQLPNKHKKKYIIYSLINKTKYKDKNKIYTKTKENK